MKDYELGTWGVSFIFSLEGSVFPKAFACAFANAVVAVGLWYLLREVMPQESFDVALSGFTASQAWNVYNWVIGFLVSFRAQRAYSRWWEGGTLLQQARGEWFNAYSSLIAFCTQNIEKMEQVQKFQKCLARLTSILYASALMSVATVDDLDFEIIDATGLSEDHLRYLRTQQDKCEIIMQWIQRLIVDSMENGVIPIPPPVLSRVFQELSRGIVNIHNVRKITEFQFPFPAAQMIVTMLIVQWMLTPLMAALLMQTPVWAFILAFFPVFACWGINYLAGEIEQPFGDDANDIPLHLMQCSLNTSLLSLLDRGAQRPPEFDSKLEATQSKLEFAEATTVKGYHSSREYKFSKMRSVRYVTIQDHEQARRVRRRFTRQITVEAFEKANEIMFSDSNYLHPVPKPGSRDSTDWQLAQPMWHSPTSGPPMVHFRSSTESAVSQVSSPSQSEQADRNACKTALFRRPQEQLDMQSPNVWVAIPESNFENDDSVTRTPTTNSDNIDRSSSGHKHTVSPSPQKCKKALLSPEQRELSMPAACCCAANLESTIGPGVTIGMQPEQGQVGLPILNNLESTIGTGIIVGMQPEQRQVGMPTCENFESTMGTGVIVGLSPNGRNSLSTTPSPAKPGQLLCFSSETKDLAYL